MVEDASVVSAAISIAKSLHMRVVAEGRRNARTARIPTRTEMWRGAGLLLQVRSGAAEEFVELLQSDDELFARIANMSRASGRAIDIFGDNSSEHEAVRAISNGTRSRVLTVSDSRFVATNDRISPAVHCTRSEFHRQWSGNANRYPCTSAPSHRRSK